jgi:hypothetical protein
MTEAAMTEVALEMECVTGEIEAGTGNRRWRMSTGYGMELLA